MTTYYTDETTPKTDKDGVAYVEVKMKNVTLVFQVNQAYAFINNMKKVADKAARWNTEE